MQHSNQEPIKIRLLRDGALMPDRATGDSTGWDLRACFEQIDQEVTIGPDPTLVPTGIAIEVPIGFDAQVRPRSGLSRQGVMVPFGTIDADYRGEVFVTMHVVGSRPLHVIKHGDRIAQLVIGQISSSVLVETNELSSTERGGGGHGSTGR
jgi:dUTP pyrophosphatase